MYQKLINYLLIHARLKHESVLELDTFRLALVLAVVGDSRDQEIHRSRCFRNVGKVRFRFGFHNFLFGGSGAAGRERRGRVGLDGGALRGGRGDAHVDPFHRAHTVIPVRNLRGKNIIGLDKSSQLNRLLLLHAII